MAEDKDYDGDWADDITDYANKMADDLKGISESLSHELGKANEHPVAVLHENTAQNLKDRAEDAVHALMVMRARYKGAKFNQSVAHADVTLLRTYMAGLKRAAGVANMFDKEAVSKIEQQINDAHVLRYKRDILAEKLDGVLKNLATKESRMNRLAKFRRRVLHKLDLDSDTATDSNALIELDLVKQKCAIADEVAKTLGMSDASTVEVLYRVRVLNASDQQWLTTLNAKNEQLRGQAQTIKTYRESNRALDAIRGAMGIGPDATPKDVEDAVRNYIRITEQETCEDAGTESRAVQDVPRVREQESEGHGCEPGEWGKGLWQRVRKLCLYPWLMSDDFRWQALMRTAEYCIDWAGSIDASQGRTRTKTRGGW